MINDIIITIKQKIEGITEVAVVYDYDPKDLVSYPAVVVSASRFGGSNYIDLGHYNRVVHISIKVYGLLTDNHEDTQKAVRDIAEKIMDVLDDDITLGNTVNNLAVEGIDYRYIVEQDMYTAELDLVVNVTVNWKC